MPKGFSPNPRVPFCGSPAHHLSACCQCVLWNAHLTLLLPSLKSVSSLTPTRPPPWPVGKKKKSVKSKFFRMSFEALQNLVPGYDFYSILCRSVPFSYSPAHRTCWPPTVLCVISPSGQLQQDGQWLGHSNCVHPPAPIPGLRTQAQLRSAA